MLLLIVACSAAPPSPAVVAESAPTVVVAPEPPPFTGEVFGSTSFRADSYVDSLSISDTDELVTLDHSGRIVRFSLPSGERIGTVPTPCEGRPQQVALSAQGTHVAVTCDEDVRIAPIGSGAWSRSETLAVGYGPHALRWAADGAAVMVNGREGFVLVGIDGKTVARGTGPTPLLPLANGVWAGTRDYDGTLPARGWSVAGGELWTAPVGVVRAATTVQGDLVALCDDAIYRFEADGTLAKTPIPENSWRTGYAVGVGDELWVRNDRTVQRVRPDGTVAATLDGAGHHLFASPDGRYVAAAESGRIDVWRGDGTRLTPTDGLTQGAQELRWSLDGSAVAATDGVRVVRLTRSTGEVRTAELADVESLSWSPTGLLAMSSRDGVWVWGADPQPIPAAGDSFSGVLWGHDGLLRIFDCGGSDWAEGRMEVRAVEPPAQKAKLRAMGTCHFTASHLSPDGKTVAAISMSSDGSHLVDAETGAIVEYPGSVADVVWLPDGKALLSLPIGDGRDGAALRTWPGPGPDAAAEWPDIRALFLAPEGKKAASWTDGTLTIWDVATRKALHTYATPEAQLFRFSPDGKSVAFVAGDGLLRIVPS